MLDDGDALVVTVADSGAGLDAAPDEPDSEEPGAAGPADDAGAVHGHGLGLPLSREIARRGGGDLWVIDRGGDAHGAVFAARLDGAVAPVGELGRADPGERGPAGSRPETRAGNLPEKEESR